MLIAVSVKKPELTSELSDVFGRSKYFLLYNTSTKSAEFLINPFAAELGGAGIQSARFLIERKIEVVITTYIGLNTLRFLSSLNIKVYHCSDHNSDDVVKLFEGKKLKEYLAHESDTFQPGRKGKFHPRRSSYPNNNFKNKK